MKFAELMVLLPCHSLEDFPVHHAGDEAAGLLAAWSGMWHPALLAAAGKLPAWYRADSPPDNLAGRLIIVPEASESLLLAGWAARAKGEGAHLVRKLADRREVVVAALAELDDGDRGVEAELAGDFLALGTCYLLTELLTRQMRYMSNIDETHLTNEAIAAANAAVAHDEETARRHLRNCFEVLTEARERFYPVHAYMVDLTLVAPTTLGADLRKELASEVPKNFLISGEVLETLARDEPDSLAALRLALDHATADVVGGEQRELATPLLPLESALAELETGLATYERILGRRPTVYGRRRFGLTPVLPQMLTRLGFDGALHITLDDGQFPQADQCKTRWEGLDPTAIDALCRLPLDAAAAESFLSLPRKMGESMDLDHVATVIFAHWPGRTSPYYDDLRRMAAYGAILGKFITLAEYFTSTERPGEMTRFKPDQYRSPYLKQAIIRGEADFFSRTVRDHEQRATVESCRALEVFNKLVGGAGATHPHEPPSVDMPGDALDQRRKTAAAALATLVTGKAATDNRGVLVVNSASFGRRIGVDVSSLSSLPACEGGVLAVEQNGARKLALVDVPACGVAWIVAGQGPAKPGKPLAEGNVLRNEFCELTVHRETGGIRSIYVPHERGNRLSQQLALRLPAPRPEPGDVWRDPDEQASYSEMVAERVEVTAAGTVFGEITTRGELRDREGKRLAGFVQRMQIWRGVRVIGLEIELDVAEVPRADPWNSYYASRFAWAAAEAELARSVSGTTQPGTGRRLESPLFVEIRGEKARTSLLTGGLAYHKFNGERMLDSLLVVKGETCRRFRFGIGIDVPYPAAAAQELLEPAVVLPDSPISQPQNGSAWFFHLDVRNVLATHWELGDDAGGFRVRLLETEGRAGRVHLRLFREPRSARQVDFRGGTLLELPIEADRVAIDLAAFEWIEVAVSW